MVQELFILIYIARHTAADIHPPDLGKNVMVIEILKAAFLGALPVMVFTFLILQWSIRSGRLQAFDGETNLQKQYRNQIQAQKTARKAAKKEAKAASTQQQTIAEKTNNSDGTPLFSKQRGGDIFHGKVMSFGGGFYGTMAVMTYALIELIEIWQFLGKIFGPGSWFENIGINMLVDFIVNSVMNFVAAFLWFQTLAKYLPVGNGWIWLAAAYIGYMGALKLVTRYGDDIWERLLNLLPKAT